MLDIFKIQQFKDQIAYLQEANDRLQDANRRLVEENNEKLSVKQKTNIELDRDNKEKLMEQEGLISDVEDLKDELNHLKMEIEEKNKELADVGDQIYFEQFGLYKPHYSFANSSSYKAQLDQTRATQKNMIRENIAATIFRPMMLDNSKSKGEAMQKKNIKQLLRAFNGECEAAINRVTKANIETIEKKISNSFNQLNKLNGPNGVRISTAYFDEKINESHIALEYAMKKDEEKELLREEREREREERQLQQELSREKKKYEKDEDHFIKAQQELTEKISQTNDSTEIDSLKSELAELQAQLDEIRVKKDKLTDRAENPTAGYVYIISNIGSFGKDVFKIGVTRRLEPMDRINELGSASVPFKFDVHALIFSNDAFKLESELHHHFNKQRLNQVNNRKEYFNITIDDVKDVLKNYQNLTFDFHEIPDAIEYRESCKIKQSISQAN